MKTIFTILFIVVFSNLLPAQLFIEKSLDIGFDHYFKDRALIGGGAAFFDFDNDGDEDFYVTGGLNADDLYLNNGDGTFSKILADIGLGVTQKYNTMSVCTGDVDNDGDREVFVSTWEWYAGGQSPIARNLLFENNGDGTFTEIGAFAGIHHAAFSHAAGFLDYNKDGYLDIYVMNHIDTPKFTMDSTGMINGYDHDCYQNFFYINNGDLTFSEVSEELGINSEGCSIAAAPTDYDLDGDLDLFIANDFGGWLTPNELFQNNYPENGFNNVSESTGADIETWGMGIAVGDYDQDLDLDYYTTNIGRNVLLENENGTFEDVTASAGVENAMVNEFEFTTGWGTAFFDIDNDSWEDLFVANGRIPSLPGYPTSMVDPDKLYLNRGDKTFIDITDEAGVGDVSYSHGMAYADFDLDGDLDIITVALAELGGRSKFYINEVENENNYIQFKLQGVESNRDAFGSKIWLFSGDRIFLKELHGGGVSHASQHSSVFHFGLGEMETVDSLRIQWTNGLIETTGPMEINMRHDIREGDHTNTSAIGDHLSIQAQIIISPNPFSEYIRIESKNPIQNADIMLFDANGVLLFSITKEVLGVLSFEIPQSMDPGIYILMIRSKNIHHVSKLVKYR